jgi:hypothetical protein
VPSFEHLPHARRGLDGPCTCDSCALRLSQTRSLWSRLPMIWSLWPIIFGFVALSCRSVWPSQGDWSYWALAASPCRQSLSLPCAPEDKQVILILCSLRVTADVKALSEAAAAAKVLIVIPLLSRQCVLGLVGMCPLLSRHVFANLSLAATSPSCCATCLSSHLISSTLVPAPSPVSTQKNAQDFRQSITQDTHRVSHRTHTECHTGHNCCVQVGKREEGEARGIMRPYSAATTQPSPPPTSGQEEAATTAPDTPRRQAEVTPSLPRRQPTHDWERDDVSFLTSEDRYNSTSEDSYNSMEADDSIMTNDAMTHAGSGLNLNFLFPPPTASWPRVESQARGMEDRAPRQRTVSTPMQGHVSNLGEPMRGRGGSVARLSLHKRSGALGGGGGGREGVLHVVRQAPAQGGAAKTKGGAAKAGAPARSHALRSHASHYTNTHETMQAPQGATASGTTTKGSRMSTPSFVSSYATQHQGRTTRGSTPSSKPVSKAGTYATSGEGGGGVAEREARKPKEKEDKRKPREKEDKRRLSKRAAAAAAGAAVTGAAITTWL